MRNLFTFLCIITQVTFCYCQNINPRRPFEPVSFKGYKPLWYTMISDSMLIDKSLRRNAHNKIDNNQGLSEIYTDDQLLYSLSISRGNDFEGSYLGSINYKNGQREWSNYFNLSTQDRQEFTRSMHISDGKLQLIGMKTQSLYGSSFLPIFFFDTLCYMTNRYYDFTSGQLISNFQADPSDPNAQRLALGTTETIKFSNIFKISEDQYRFVYHHKVRPENTIDFGYLDQYGIKSSPKQSIKLDKRHHAFNFFHLDSDQYLWIEDKYLETNNQYILHFLDENLQIYKSVPVQISVERSAGFRVNVKEKYLVTGQSSYAPEDTLRLKPQKKLFFIDFDGHVLKEVDLKDDKGRAMERTASVYDKSTNNLIVVFADGQGLFDPPKSKLYFYQSSDQDKELNLKHTLFVEDSLKVMFIQRMTKTPDGNLVLLWEELDVYAKNGRYNDLDGYSEAMSYVCFDPKTLGLVSKTTEINANLKCKLFPNPTSSTLNIESLSSPATVNITNINGQLVRKISNVEREINISDLPAGMYIIDIKNGEINEQQRIIKVE